MTSPIKHFYLFKKGYFETARSELTSKGISVTMLCPGPVFSDILSACATENPGEVSKIK